MTIERQVVDMFDEALEGPKAITLTFDLVLEDLRTALGGQMQNTSSHMDL